MKMTGTVIHRIENGKIAEKWWDKVLMPLLRQHLAMIAAKDNSGHDARLHRGAPGERPLHPCAAVRC